MSTQPAPYTKDELIRLAVDALPTRGERCPKCGAIIPQFADLTDKERGRIRHLILEGRTTMAMHELRSITLCPVAWARIWVEHSSHILDAQAGARKISWRQRELYVYDDDFCSQQLLPRDAAAYAEAEIIKMRELVNAPQASAGLGRTAVYVRQEVPVRLRTLKIKKELLAEVVSPFLPPFDVVCTGYNSPPEQCSNTWAWGRSPRCALLAYWDDEGIVANVYAQFFDDEEVSIVAAAHAVAALGHLHPLVYVDWAWGYTCDASTEDAFASMLTQKLKTIADRTKPFMKS